MAEAKEKKSRLLGAGEIGVSFEFFPPKSEKMEEQLWSSINRLVRILIFPTFAISSFTSIAISCCFSLAVNYTT